MGRLVIAVAASAALCAHGEALAAPKAVLEGELEPGLRAAITRAIGETDKPAASRFDARRRAREAGEAAQAVLRSEGYYGATVETDVGDGEPAQALVRVTPGPVFRLRDAAVEWVGTAPPDAVQRRAVEALDLVTGAPGRAEDVLAAEGRAVAVVQKQGFADVAPAPREVIVDHADASVQPTFRINAGQLVRLDGLELVTAGRTNPRWLRRLAPWNEGDPYDPEDVAELERRLLDTGVYDSVTVALAPADRSTPEGLRPIVVSVADRARRTIEVGASYSTTEGLGAEVRWTRYNVLGRADTLGVLARASNLDSRLGVELTLPHWRRPQQTLRTGAAAYSVKTDAYDETGVGARVDVERRFSKTSYLTVGGSIDYGETQEKQIELTPLGRELVTIAGLAALALDRSDDPLDPRRGWRVEARLEPTYITGEESLPYLKTQTQGSIYVPFDTLGRTVAAGRVRVGAMLGGSIPEVPASRRFYAGGGGSVRGYAYQAIGPRLADNTPQGGASLFEASLELRQKLKGPWGMAAFVDVGAVGSDQFPTGDDFSVGVGVGVRYDLGFGPIRADIAVPLDARGDQAFQVYLSIGQSF